MHTHENHAYDAVIVGARLAGAATAMLLSRFGLRVLLVDRSRLGTDTMSTHALMRGGVLQLSRWGLLGAVVAAGTPPVHRTTFRYASGVVPVAVKSSFGVDALYAPRRTVLDPIVVDAAVAAGAEVRFGTAVTGVTRDDDGRVTGVLGRTRAGRPFRARARTVVGADGIRSAVARLVGAPTERTGSSVASVTYGHWTGLETDGYEWNFRSAGSSGVVPTNNGQACVYVSAPPERIGRGGLAPLTRIVAESSPPLARRLAEAVPPAALRTFTGHRGYVRRAWGPGWALVGDAGYFKDPLTAHGQTDALRDAELLARALVAAADGVRTEADALADYQHTRDALSTTFFELTDVVAGHRWTDEEIPDVLRQLSAAMSDEVKTLHALPPVPPALRSVHCG
ncbi:MAG TPA: NAD(P)/FAD-dependent oxidoreductase [Actinophytocola sp.]|nr:NAD(P)/FAD-dependent oxidoreductase [Actinophytocola sp.]